MFRTTRVDLCPISIWTSKDSFKIIFLTSQKVETILTSRHFRSQLHLDIRRIRFASINSLVDRKLIVLNNSFAEASPWLFLVFDCVKFLYFIFPGLRCNMFPVGIVVFCRRYGRSRTVRHLGRSPATPSSQRVVGVVHVQRLIAVVQWRRGRAVETSLRRSEKAKNILKKCNQNEKGEKCRHTIRAVLRIVGVIG